MASCTTNFGPPVSSCYESYRAIVHVSCQMLGSILDEACHRLLILLQHPFRTCRVLGSDNSLYLNHSRRPNRRTSDFLQDDTIGNDHIGLSSRLLPVVDENTERCRSASALSTVTMSSFWRHHRGRQLGGQGWIPPPMLRLPQSTETIQLG